MSYEWIEGNQNKMLSDGAPEVSKTASDIFEFLDNGGNYTASIFRTRNTGYVGVKYRNMTSAVYILWK